MRNKKILFTTLITFLILVEVSTVFLMYKSYKGKGTELDKVNLNKEINSEMFAIMLEQIDDEGNSTYVESSDNSWPSSDYVFNEAMSGCIDSDGNKLDGVLTYDSVNNIATVETGNTTYCYLYFKLPEALPEAGPDLTIILSGTTGTNQTGKYVKSIDCGNTTSATFNQIYQRVEIGSVTTPAKCTLKYTTDTSTYTTLKNKVESVTQNYDGNGYRYSGKTPNNWVWFNGERWRIIGSIPTCTSKGCATSERLVKIIRNASLGVYTYDAMSTGGTGAWGSNTLYELLNKSYYATDATKMNGQSHEGCYGYYDSYYGHTPKPNCDFTEKGILSNSYYGKMVKKVFWNTGKSDYAVTAATSYTNEIKTQTVSGHVGLMTASDWGYAADSSYHNTLMSKYSDYYVNGATEKSWIFSNGYEWTSTQHSTDTDCVVSVEDSGWLVRLGAIYGYVVRPVVYLDASVYIISGDGSQSNPYQIGM